MRNTRRILRTMFPPLHASLDSALLLVNRRALEPQIALGW
jgi:hypothetical protein